MRLTVQTDNPFLAFALFIIGIVLLPVALIIVIVGKVIAPIASWLYMGVLWVLWPLIGLVERAAWRVLPDMSTLDDAAE